MKPFLIQLKWQFVLLHKNSILVISAVVTIIYGGILFALKGIGGLEQVLVALVLNDPSVIGYFFIALAIYTEIKHQILPAIFVSPINLHHYLLSKTIALTIIGTICALGLAISVKGVAFDILSYSLGVLVICLLSTMLGIIMLTFADEFLKFAMLSAPVFLAFTGLPLMQYLGVFDMGLFKFILPIQGCVDLLEHAMTGQPKNNLLIYGSLLFWLPIFYIAAFRLFNWKLVCQ